MPTPPRHHLLTLSIVLALVACEPSGPATSHPPTPAASFASIDPTAPASTAPQAGQTNTEWGRIWDDVPAGFPTFPGSTVTDDVSAEPASARYVVADGDPQEIAAWLQTALETATYSTEALSGPLEDGGFVLDSLGDAGCRIETRVAPLGGMTLVTVRYGAVCPTG